MELNLKKLFVTASLLTGCSTLILFNSASAQTRPAASENVSVTPKAIPRAIGATGADYVGNDRCRSCHKPEFVEFGKTVHASIPEHKNSPRASTRLRGHV